MPSKRTFQLVSAALSGLAAIAAGTWYYATRVEPGWLRVTSLSLVLPRLHPAFDNYRIIHISDIHLGTWINRQRLATIVDYINHLHGNLIAITGDFVTDIYHNTPIDLTDTLSALDAPDGIFAVLGNHDYWSDVTTIRQILEASGVTELRNSVHTLRRGGGTLHIAGIDNYWENKARLRDVLAQLPPEGAAILLAHEPDYAVVSAQSGRFDLQLSGHTHGGQFIIPKIGPLTLPMYGRRYPDGLYQTDGMYIYTNRGIGTARQQFRLNCRPEIAMITLHAPVVQSAHHQQEQEK